MELGATWYPGLTYGRAIAMVDDYRPGDVAFTNDPYSGHVATHAPDTHLWKPVFAEGEIVAWTGGHIHNTDMGGAVPASLSRSLTEIHQEGIRFPPMKLVREGVFDEQILRIMATNVRKPDAQHRRHQGAGRRAEHRRAQGAGDGRALRQGAASCRASRRCSTRPRRRRATILRAIPDGDMGLCRLCRRGQRSRPTPAG